MPVFIKLMKHSNRRLENKLYLTRLHNFNSSTRCRFLTSKKSMRGGKIEANEESYV